jgi:hypothetical protein
LRDPRYPDHLAARLDLATLQEKLWPVPYLVPINIASSDLQNTVYIVRLCNTCNSSNTD